MPAEAPAEASRTREAPPALPAVTHKKLLNTKARADAALRHVRHQLPPQISALPLWTPLVPPPEAPFGAPQGAPPKSMSGAHPWCLLDASHVTELLKRPASLLSVEPLRSVIGGNTLPAAPTAAAAADAGAAASAAAAAAAVATLLGCPSSQTPFPAAAVEEARLLLQQQWHAQQQQQQQQQEEDDESGSPLSGFAVSAAVVATRRLQQAGVQQVDPSAVAASIRRVFLVTQQTPHQPDPESEPCGPRGAPALRAAAAAEARIHLLHREHAAGQRLRQQEPHEEQQKGREEQQQEQQQQEQRQQQTTAAVSGLWYVRGPPDFKLNPEGVPQEELTRNRGALLAAAVFSSSPGAAAAAVRAEAHHFSLPRTKQL
ncbi:hypothetical protein Efla_001260 [Eimeria flavescens]